MKKVQLAVGFDVFVRHPIQCLTQLSNAAFRQFVAFQIFPIHQVGKVLNSGQQFDFTHFFAHSPLFLFEITNQIIAVKFLLVNIVTK